MDTYSLRELNETHQPEKHWNKHSVIVYAFFPGGVTSRWSDQTNIGMHWDDQGPQDALVGASCWHVFPFEIPIMEV